MAKERFVERCLLLPSGVAEVLQAVFSHGLYTYRMIHLCRRRTFLIPSKFPLQQVVTWELPCVISTMTDIYWHSVAWEQSNALPLPNLAVCTFLTLRSCLWLSLPCPERLLHWMEVERWWSPFGEEEDCVGLYLGQNLSFRHTLPHQTVWLRISVLKSPSFIAHRVQHLPWDSASER